MVSPRSRVTVSPAILPVKKARMGLRRASSGVARTDEMVEMRGLEPLTPSLQRRCSPS